ncbi:MAG: hypothetical protein J0M08_04780 [Bacteroidetes bacterium]|nr:hypothetical protein [Bacteroidota bacterium]
MSKVKNVLKVFIISCTIFIVVVILFISPLTKFLIEKYDVKYFGREIKMDWVYVNPFSGYIHFSNLKIYALQSDSIFFSAKRLNANLKMNKLLSQTYEFSSLTLDYPKGHIFQNKEYFNFNDLIAKFSSKENSKSKKEPLHFSILNIKIHNGEFHYREIVTPINYFIKNVNIESKGFRWNVDTIPISFSFLSGIGTGSTKGDFVINSKNKNYTLAT